LDKIEYYNDVATLNEYKHLVATGGNIPQFIENIKFSCRDNGRTPFQWDNSTNAGFTTGKPWLKINPNYTTINAAAQDKDPNSTLNYFRALVKLRKENKVLVYGKYELLDKDNPNVYAYSRTLNGKTVLVLLNFTSKVNAASLPTTLQLGKTLINNLPNTLTLANGSTTLQPYQACVIEVK